MNFSESHKEEKNFGFIEQLYIWSIVFEPLLLFVIFSQNQVGISGNVSRILQLLVIFLLFLRFLITPLNEVKVFNPLYKNYFWYFFYTLFLLVSYLFGYFMGYFNQVDVSINNSASFFSSFINSPSVRPFLEYLISIYQFIYFSVLPLFLLRSKKAVDFIFNVILAFIFLSLIIGFIDYFLVVFFQTEFLPRHLSDMRHVGNRFHAMAGEPRDAAVYLSFCIAFFVLYNERNNEKKISYSWFIAALVALILTQSFSGYLGILLGASFILIYMLPFMSLRQISFLLFTLLFFILILIYYISQSERIMLYITALPIAIDAIERGQNLPYVIEVQISNFYPLWLRFLEVLEFNILPTLIGTGFGSSAVANAEVMDPSGVLNPNANIIRIFFESGLIGLLLYLTAFLYPIIKSRKKFINKNLLIITVLFLIGATLAHRSALIYIYLGLFLVIVNYQTKNRHASQ